MGDEMTKMTAAAPLLLEALEGIAIRKDGDGLPCWCINFERGPAHLDMVLRDGHFQIDHKPWCLAARAAIAAARS